MAAGFALCEDLGINSKGVPTKDSLKKYNTLNAADMPAVKTILVEEGGDKGPFGAKSIGEISTVPGAAAIVNAVNNAPVSYTHLVYRKRLYNTVYLMICQYTKFIKIYFC